MFRLTAFCNVHDTIQHMKYETYTHRQSSAKTEEKSRKNDTLELHGIQLGKINTTKCMYKEP